MNLNEIMSTLRKVYDKYAGIRLGIAGSFANGTQKPGSDIDVVIDGDSMRVDIMEYIKSQFQNDVDVLWVELTEESKSALSCLDARILKYFRNQIDHVYEKVNKTYLKPFIFSVISKEAVQEVKERIKYCTNQTKETE